MDWIDVDDGRLGYEVAGTGEPVIFIHGAFIADAFRPLLAIHSLNERYQLINYHRRGYGASSRASGVVSLAQQTADCVALLRHLGIDRAHVTGHSYGGAVALELALTMPTIVHTLALLEPALIVGANAQEYRDALKRSRAHYDVAPTKVVVDEFLRARSPEYGMRLNVVLPGAFEQAVADAGTFFENELPGLLEWTPRESDVRHIRQPVLSVLGGRSKTLWARFEETHRLLLTWLPHAEAVELPGATHLMPIEDAHRLSDSLARYWSRHPFPAI